MSINSQFRRRSGCFSCTLCGRRTRHTGENNHTELCPECCEACEVENGIMDNSYQGADLAIAEARIAELQQSARSKGGIIAA